MRILKFHGYSDDTFGEYGETGQDVDNCGSLDGFFDLEWYRNGARVEE